MEVQRQKWSYLIVLSLVWGSSFILIKRALLGLSPIQVGALRMLITSVFLLLVGYKSIGRIRKKHWKYIVYTALLGTFFPSFLFAYAILHIDSSIAAILNSLTPFNTFLVGVLIFGFSFQKKQLIGIFIGLIGTALLILKGADINATQNYWAAILVLISSLGYAFNVNIVKKQLHDLDALAITTGNFLLLGIPALGILGYTGFFNTVTHTAMTLPSLGYVTVLAIFGTGIAKVFFNKLVHIATPIFASSVTYLIPVVAVFWGVWDGEVLSATQLFGGVIILWGVFLLNKKKTTT